MFFKKYFLSVKLANKSLIYTPIIILLIAVPILTQAAINSSIIINEAVSAVLRDSMPFIIPIVICFWIYALISADFDTDSKEIIYFYKVKNGSRLPDVLFTYLLFELLMVPSFLYISFRMSAYMNEIIYTFVFISVFVAIYCGLSYFGIYCFRAPQAGFLLPMLFYVATSGNSGLDFFLISKFTIDITGFNPINYANLLPIAGAAIVLFISAYLCDRSYKF